MSDGSGGANRRLELVEVIHRVRNRWRMRLAIRGAVFVVAGTLLALFLSASSLQALRFTAVSIIGFRVIALAVFATLVWYGLILPLRRRVTDAQVARYLEECDPTLQEAIMSAVDAASHQDLGQEHGPSPRLVDKLIEQAIARCEAIDAGMGIETEWIRRHAMALGGVALAAVLLLLFGPAFLRQGMSALLVFSRSAEAASPYHIDVQPGNAKVPRGSDQSVKAKLLGFATKDATLMVRTERNGAFEALPLAPSKDPSMFEGLIFHLDKDADYYVEANGVKSPTFTMSVLDLPTVKDLAIEYRFPAYTGLEPRTVQPAGDVAALAGTEVRLKVTPTMVSNGGKIWLNDTTALPLAAQGDGTLTGAFTLDKQGFYRIELNGPHNEPVKASPQYTIDVLADEGPVVKFSKPGRDTQASPVEEVFAEVRADDDFGVKQMQMFYSVNGGDEKTITLFNGAKPQAEVTASHTIYLEELGLKPGDFVSYYAKATDNNGVAGGQTTTSDIYFVQIRPFKKDYTAAASQGGGGGGGGGDQVGNLSEQQRQIVAATFNTVRDRAKNKEPKYKEDTVFLTLAQAKLRGQVEELAGKMNSRLDAVDPAYQKIAEALPKAAKEMQAAEGNLKNLAAKEALTPEQRALKLLQDAEQEYEVQVSQQRGGGGGGGGGAQQSQDLADLFELEMDKLANQYEVQQRADQQSGDKQIDELANKLKDMAKREQQEAERAARMQQGAGGGAASADNQRQLAQQLEEAARQLEQLSRNEPRQNLSDAARQLRDAANQMRQAAANGSADGGAAAQAALQKLRDAQQKLTQNQSGRGERDLAQAKRDADQLSADQKDVQQREQQLTGMNATDRATQTRSIQQKKDDMDKRLGQLQDDLEKRANDMRSGEKDAARKLDEAAGSITDKRMREKVQDTRAVMNSTASNTGDIVRSVEDDLAGNLDALSKKVGDAQAAVGQQNKQDTLAKAADKTGDMRRSLESMLNGEQGQQGQGSQNGQQNGQQAQNGQRGQQGQQGQNGQQGQQGQGQQAQNGQGQQGQQGQGQQGQGQGQGQGQQGQQGRGQGQGQGQGNGGQQANNGGGNGGGYNNGNYNGGAYNGGPRNGMNGNQPIFRMTDEQIRQARRQAQEMAQDAQTLRKMLTEAGQPTRDFDEIQRAIQDLQAPKVYDDGQNLAALQQAALDKLKKFEFGLRKQVDGGDQPLSLSGSDEVPAVYRDAISEYYKSLAKK